MRVQDLGEFNLIERLAETVREEAAATEQPAKPGFRLRLSIGDDAAAWDSPAGTSVLTSDAMVEGVHFDLEHIGWRDLGWKSIAINLSDIAAMGCTPLYSVVTLGLRGDLPVAGLLEMYRGMVEASSQHGCAIVGGDTVRSPVVFVAVTMTGAAHRPPGEGNGEGALLTRGSARPGDKVAVTGSLGCSAGGLRALNQNLALDQDTSDHLVAAHHRPAPRVNEGMVLAQHGVAAAIDVSDGLVDDLGKMCKASGVGARIHSDLVPVDEFLRRAYPADWMSLALSGGEDYELLFTATPQTMEAVAPLLDVPVSIIGDIVEGPEDIAVLDESGAPMPVDRAGWDHFRGPDKGD